MAFNFKKSVTIGVAVTPERGLEVAQVDFATRTVLKYGRKPLPYDNNRKEIADLDIFKETLQDLFFELEVPKGAEIILSLPSIVFKVSDYPASLDETQVMNAIEEELANHYIFQNTEACVSATRLPNSTIQFNKIAYTVAQKVMLIEIAMQIKELGCTLVGIDTSVNSILNSLIYNGRVNTSPDFSWVMLIVDNSFCRILSMQGNTYVDSFEERISIGEVLGDAENYSIISTAVNPILKNLPSECLYIVSTTGIISAKVLADKISYVGQIIHEDANDFAPEPFIDLASEVNKEQAKSISLEVIGASINKAFAPYSSCNLNLFNEQLGDIYILEQPLTLAFGSLRYTLSVEHMIGWSIAFLSIVAVITGLALFLIAQPIKQNKEEIAHIQQEIAKIDKYLKDNEKISSELFDEGDEIRIGLVHNKGIYSYYSIVGTEIPQKVWLTGLSLGKNITIEGQADNLESVYSFYRNIKDYNQNSGIKLQKLALATNSNTKTISELEDFDTESIITSMNADFYEFVISDAKEVVKKDDDESKKSKSKNSKKSSKKNSLPELEPLE